MQHLVAHVAIDPREVIERGTFVGIEVVYFVEHQDHGHAIGFGRREEAINEGGRRLGTRNGGH